MPKTTSIHSLIFNLDGTLFDCPVLLKKQRQVAVSMVQDYHDIDRDHAVALLTEKESRLRNLLGFDPTTACVVECGVSLSRFLKEAARRYDSTLFLQRDERLIEVLKRLRLRYSLRLLTNNIRAHVDRMLQVISINEVFDTILTFSEIRIIKPSAQLYRIICKRLQLAAMECVAIGDRRHIDLTPAEKLGMRNILVSGVVDIFVFESLLSQVRAAFRNGQTNRYV